MITTMVLPLIIKIILIKRLIAIKKNAKINKLMTVLNNIINENENEMLTITIMIKAILRNRVIAMKNDLIRKLMTITNNKNKNNINKM